MYYSRRDFLKLSGAASIAFAIGLSACDEKFKPLAISNNDKINIGLVGCGQRGLDQILKGVRYLNDYHLHSVCDVIDYQMERVSEYINYPVKHYNDYRELVLNPEIDLVIVATPLKWHFEICKAALLANKHVMCEKVMTFTVDEARELEQIVAKSHKLFCVAFVLRNNPAYLVAKDLIVEGALGAVHHVNCTWNRNSDWRRPVKEPDKLVYFPTGEIMTQDKLLNWRMGTEFTCGIMSEILSHQVDAAEWLLSLGVAEQAVGFGSTSYWKDGRTSFDNVHTTLKYKDLIMSCNSVIYNAYEDYKLEILGRNGTIVLSMSSGVFIPEQIVDKKLKNQLDAVTGASYKIIKKSEGRKLKRENPVNEYYSKYVESFDLDTLMSYHEFAQCIRNNKPTPISVTEGLINVRNIVLANNSINRI